jgi:hypothetical protein
MLSISRVRSQAGWRQAPPAGHLRHLAEINRTVVALQHSRFSSLRRSSRRWPHFSSLIVSASPPRMALADFVEQAIQARRLGAFGFAQVAIA